MLEGGGRDFGAQIRKQREQRLLNWEIVKIKICCVFTVGLNCGYEELTY